MQAIHQWALSVKQKKAYVNTLFVVLNIIVFVLMELGGNREDAVFILQWGAGYPPAYAAGEYWRLFTLIFLHGDLEHLINNIATTYY